VVISQWQNYTYLHSKITFGVNTCRLSELKFRLQFGFYLSQAEPNAPRQGDDVTVSTMETVLSAPTASRDEARGCQRRQVAGCCADAKPVSEAVMSPALAGSLHRHTCQSPIDNNIGGFALHKLSRKLKQSNTKHTVESSPRVASSSSSLGQTSMSQILPA
jgi:hypothetical protein